MRAISYVSINLILPAIMTFGGIQTSGAEMFMNLDQDRVAQHLTVMTGQEKRDLMVRLERSREFLPLIQAVLASRGLPLELAYIPVIESGFEPAAVGPNGSTGLWQFQPNTAEQLGLVVNDYLDERFDPLKSSLAAAEYLLYLYRRFESWPLALAAYNCGEGKLRKAMSQTGESTYRNLVKRTGLPGITKTYVYRLAAVSLIAQNPSRYGLSLDP